MTCTTESKFVEQLRFLASGQDDPQSVALAKAADEIERQITRIAKLESEKVNLLDVAAYYACDCEDGNCLEFMRGELCGLKARQAVKDAGLKTHNEWMEEATACQAEIERLRAALQQIADMQTSEEDGVNKALLILSTSIARKALREKE